MNAGEIIKNARKAKGYTQEELGLMLGVEKCTISKYELGHIENVKRETMKKLANILQIDPRELIGGNADYSDSAGKIAEILVRYPDALSVLENYLKLDSADRLAISQILKTMVCKV